MSAGAAEPPARASRARPWRCHLSRTPGWLRTPGRRSPRGQPAEPCRSLEVSRSAAAGENTKISEGEEKPRRRFLQALVALSQPTPGLAESCCSQSTLRHPRPQRSPVPSPSCSPRGKGARSCSTPAEHTPPLGTRRLSLLAKPSRGRTATALAEWQETRLRRPWGTGSATPCRRRFSDLTHPSADTGPLVSDTSRTRNRPAERDGDVNPIACLHSRGISLTQNIIIFPLPSSGSHKGL